MAGTGISRFRTPALIERVKADAVKDESGRPDLTDDDNWETYIARRIELIAITAKESIYAQQPMGDITHRVTLRRDDETAAITSKMRVRVGTRKLNITKSIDVGNPPRLKELSCTEVA